MPIIHQRHGRTDGRTDERHTIAILRYHYVHRAVKSARSIINIYFVCGVDATALCVE